MPLHESTLPVIAVGSSAGGIEALWQFLAALPTDLPAAVLVVQHMSPNLDSRLPEVLGSRSALPVKAAEHGETIRPRQVFIATPDHHLLLEGDKLRLGRGPKESRVRPAVDALFRSVAGCCASRSIGIVLSGTLDDGTAGLWAIKDRKGLAFVQEPAEAIYDSMPKSAIAHVAVDAVAGASAIARIAALSVRRLLDQPPQELPMQEDIETSVAAGVPGLALQIRALGTQSVFTCPDCHGAFTRIQEGKINRFRCHTGHAHTQQSLEANLDQAIDESLWNAIRALEERLMLSPSEETPMRAKVQVELLRAIALNDDLIASTALALDRLRSAA